MKIRKIAASCLLIVIALYSFVFHFPNAQAEVQEKMEKWFESKPAPERDANAKLYQAAEYADQMLGVTNKGYLLKAQSLKRWTIFGKFGYEYDDNVRLASSHKAFRLPGEDPSAGRFTIQSGFGYTLFRNPEYMAGINYVFTQYLHDDSLNEFNFQNHAVSLFGRKKLTMWERPADVMLRYTFSYGILDGAAFSNNHYWNLSWKGEWKENWVLTVYDRIGLKLFRDDGYDNHVTSRDGLSNALGFIQSYYFDHRRRQVYGGYEFALDATRGKNFDQIANGFRIGLKTPVVEKIDFETNFFFQDGYYNHYAGKPNRHDLRYFYEFKLSRPIGSHWRITGFYKRTDVNTLHDGSLGLYNYHRNIYGFEASFLY